MDGWHALSGVAPDGGEWRDQVSLGGDGERTQAQILFNQKMDGHQVKNKREQWTVISSVLSGLWKGQHV